MPRYDRGFRSRHAPWGGDWSDSGGGYGWGAFGRRDPGDRPRVGGYREGYQGGSGGMRTGGGPTPGRDEWWLGGHYPGRYGRDYDRAYQDFDRQNRPRFSPVAGNYHAMGGSYARGRPPRPLREDAWFSDWTRWF